MNRYYFDESEKLYKQEDVTAFNEAIVTFGGEIQYDNMLPANFLEHAKLMLEESDLSFFPVLFGSGFKLWFQKSRFWKALSEAGLDFCLLDGDQQDSVKNEHPFFVSRGQSIQVQVNGIKIALLHSCFDQLEATATQIKTLKESGVDFLILFAKGQLEPGSNYLDLVANLGADVIALKQSSTLGPCQSIECADGRKVLVLSSVGNAVTYGKKCDSAMFRFILRRSENGGVDVEAVYVPCVFAPDLGERKNCLVPTNKHYNGGYKNALLKAVSDNVEEVIGDELQRSKKEGPYKLDTGFTPQMSVQAICKFFKVDSSFYDGDYPIDKKVRSIVIRKSELKPSSVAFLEKSTSKKVAPNVISEELAQSVKPIMVVASEKVEGIPTLVVKYPYKAYLKLMRHIRRRHKVLAVAVTGSLGKTTVTDMIKTVMGSQYLFPDVQGNFNTPRTFTLVLQKLGKRHDAYIQELHGGSPGAASLASSIIMPNIAVITSIAAVHLEQLGNSIEDVKREKLGVIDGLQEGGYLVVNNDNEYLRDLDVPVNVVTYAAFNKDSDYYAENIVENGDSITFTIVSREGRYDAKIFCLGIHNVCNAVGAFAVGSLAGIKPEKIVASLSRFRTNGYRQNLIKKDGIKIFADCYNSAPESVKSAIQSVSTISLGQNGKRIAILGDISELADISEQAHRDLGRYVASSCIDVLITFGEKAMRISEEAKAQGMEAYGFLDREKMEKQIKKIMKPGDILLFKGSHGVELDKSIDNIFGKS